MSFTRHEPTGTDTLQAAEEEKVVPGPQDHLLPARREGHVLGPDGGLGGGAWPGVRGVVSAAAFAITVLILSLFHLLFLFVSHGCRADLNVVPR